MEHVNQQARLALYHFQACPFCALTRSVLKHIDVDVEQRDIIKQPQHRKDLIAGGGRQQVPCLRIEKSGQVQWLYESRDIIDYLKRLAKK